MLKMPSINAHCIEMQQSNQIKLWHRSSVTSMYCALTNEWQSQLCKTTRLGWLERPMIFSFSCNPMLSRSNSYLVFPVNHHTKRQAPILLITWHIHGTSIEQHNTNTASQCKVSLSWHAHHFRAKRQAKPVKLLLKMSPQVEGSSPFISVGLAARMQPCDNLLPLARRPSR